MNSKSTWKHPERDPHTEVLKVRNSLTQKLEEFIPISGKNVSWYICGPTVYDSAHMGHARTYLSFDVIRRIMEDYFNYDVHYAMNITDVEDKIILGARKSYLFNQYKTSHPALAPDVFQVTEEAVLLAVRKLQKKLGEEIIKEKTYTAQHDKEKEFAEASAKIKLFQDRIDGLNAQLQYAKTGITEKPEITEKLGKSENSKTAENAKSAKNAENAENTENAETAEKSEEEKEKERIREYELYFHTFQGPLADLLDEKYGADVTDQKVFRDHAAKYEEEFYEDLEALNIRFPDVVLRVSEFIPHIVSFIEKIQEKGFAYESEGSVYFDTVAFGNHPEHTYAKLVPTAVGDGALLAEGEGELSGGHKAIKKSQNDFALWKKTKPGEPIWDSPWGPGRPGWHIECSAMAGDTFGSKIDIHSGGIDLTFPHHDNELAQSEAHFGCDQWVNYFLHSGHLNIRGLKMAKSLKNFITIRQALKEHTARQLRLMFLMQSWDKVMFYEDTAIEAVKAREKTLKEFFLTVQASLRDQRGIAQVPQLWGVKERILYATLKDVEADVHKALCNNFDTSTAMNLLNDLVTKVNTYSMKNPTRNAMLMKRVAVYITRMLRVFGVITDQQDEFGFPETREGGGGGGKASTILPAVLDTFTQFRSQIRQGAKDKKEAAYFLRLCDALRDEIMPHIGVRFEDAGDFQWKIVDKADLAREADAKKKEAKMKIMKVKGVVDNDVDRWSKASIPPKERLATLYSKFDSTNGTPIQDSAGNPISKNAKKFEKEVQKMAQDHQKYLDKIAENPNFLTELKNKQQEYEKKINEFDE